MPWLEVSIVDQRREFVALAMKDGANRRELCRRFGIHPSTAYKWLERFAGGLELVERSRRPHSSPGLTDSTVEQQVLAVRDAHPAWGARKIARCLLRDGVAAPALSTVHRILQRHGRIEPRAGGGGRAHRRFEKDAPNQLWQMDFKGWLRLADGSACHPLTIIDDHSRYCIGLEACADERGGTVQSCLERTFRRYGLPDAFFVDNGAPWGDSGGARYTRFGVWLMKLGIALLHSTPYHPQSRGKNERFHRTLDLEVLQLRRPRSRADLQRDFEAWRNVYNCERPHGALGGEPPVSRYQPSLRPMPETLPRVEYDEGEIVRTVPLTKSYIRFKGALWPVPQALRGERVAIRPLSADGRFGVFFATHRLATIDLTAHQAVGHLSEHVSAMSPG